MLPNMTAFNGKGCEHPLAGFHIPGIHFTGIMKDAKHHLAIMDMSKNAVVYAWYRLDKGRVGIHQHQRLQKDKNGTFFRVRGSKIYTKKRN